MAKKILQNYDFAGNQLIDVRVENLAAFPTAGKAGRVVLNTTTSALAYDDGSSFLPLLTSVSWSEVTGKPTTFAPSAHTHAISEVTGLQTNLDAKAPLASAALTGTPTAPTPGAANNSTRIATTAFVQNALSGTGNGDMLKSVYDTNDDGKVNSADAADSVPWTGVTGKPTTFTPSAHTHAIADVTNLQTELDGKAATNHTHSIANVTGLQTALDGKADDSHTHTAADVTDFNAEVDARIIAFIDSEAGSDADIDTLRELMDLVKANESLLTSQIGRFNDDIGDGSSTSIAVTHNLNSLDVTVEVYEIASGETVGVGVTRTNANVVTIEATPAPATNALRVVIKK